MQDLAVPTILSRSVCRRARSAFSLVELLVVIGIIAILMSLVIGGVTKLRANASTLRCISNLRQIAGAFSAYASNNGGRLPDPLRDQVPWEASLKSYMPDDSVLQCPADNEVYPFVGSSYDWRDTGDPGTTLAGQLMGSAGGDLVLAFESLPGWHEKKKINVVRVDGSAQTLDQQECFADLVRPVSGGH